MNNNEFGARLQGLRKEKNISQGELAKALECSTSSISKYELGIRTPDIIFLDNAASFFGVSVDYLLGRSMVRTDEKTSIKAVCDYLGLSEKAVEEITSIYSYTGFTSDKGIFNYLCEQGKISDLMSNIAGLVVLQAIMLSSAQKLKSSKGGTFEEKIKSNKQKYDNIKSSIPFCVEEMVILAIKHFILDPQGIDEAEYKELVKTIDDLTKPPRLDLNLDELFD